MDHVLGVNQTNRKKQAKRGRKPIKVVYISTPMKVKTSASKFRDLVQELTGQDSDTARIMEHNGAVEDGCNFHDPHQQERTNIDHFDEVSRFPLSCSYSELLQPFSEPSFKSFAEYLQMDVLRSFDPV
ncbi:Sigma factor binding protein 1, chloroplastic [Morella rubra]|uniref:Sigma factor binding protein 1, chloroplastic n=1 Tax=Morella rubra TaxID=262757 RepID=A0A6A1WIA2_9ROSI|nr:Sigma factor binding protein 1, chloroplastic [Morella rubra]KAB1225015.1 Sigma factor binding protein 1, chloroplastic [Morella rubra]